MYVDAFKRKVMVIGASTNPSRYSYRVIQILSAQGYDVSAIGKSGGQIGNTRIQTGVPLISDIHTLTVYLNKTIQEYFREYILDLKPSRVIFNPGAENSQLYPVLTAAGIDVEEACTLVLLRTGQF